MTLAGMYGVKRGCDKTSSCLTARTGTGLPPVEYHLSYTYDQGGNRLIKADWLAGEHTFYHYDVEAPETYETKNNRLMYYEVFEGVDLIETVYYEYGDNKVASGNPTFVVRVREDEQEEDKIIYHGTTLQYNNTGELWFVTERDLEQTWNELGEYWECTAEKTVSITEFRGAGRRRCMVRQRDTDEGLEKRIDPTKTSTLWSDYDGDVIYGDYVVDQDMGDAVEMTAYLPGIAQMDTQTGNVLYLHGDRIGSLRVVSTEYGAPVQHVVYTAFGEKVHQDGTIGRRYQYAGTWGYETQAEVPFVHVGHLYYDPSTGRFLQREPIGIGGGSNAYEYVNSNPLALVDPSGLHDGGPWHWKRWPSTNRKPDPKRPSCPSPSSVTEQVYDKGSRQGKSDRWMHFVVSCRVTSECHGGFVYLLPGALAKEIADIVGYSPGIGLGSTLMDSFGDMLANCAGWAMGPSAAIDDCGCEGMADNLGL